MKTVVCLLVLLALALAAPQTKYTDRFDKIDLDEILFNKRLLGAYVKCLLEQGKCTAEGRELKTHIREALETRCAKCTDAQKRGTKRVMGHLINHERQFWEQLKAKYDPGNKYSREYENELRTVQA